MAADLHRSRLASISSRAAPSAAETALVRIVHHYGTWPEFVVIGGLVPELLCAESRIQHAGTTDVDEQVNLEIACGAVNTARLERALRNAEFIPGSDQVWRWVADRAVASAIVRFELFADLHDQPTEATIEFDECQSLGAMNLRGIGYASDHIEVREFGARIGGVTHTVEVNVAGSLDSCSPRQRPRTHDEAPRTGTTSRLCSSTTTLAESQKRRSMGNGA